MEYKVINDFYDAANENTFYKAGEEYPKGNYKPTKKRLESLTSIHPKHKKAFIEEIVSEVEEVEAKNEDVKEDKKTKSKE